MSKNYPTLEFWKVYSGVEGGWVPEVEISAFSLR
jgi:hypothetical protein